MPIVEIKNLIKEFKLRRNKNPITGIWRPNYQFVRAVDDISFSIKKGESLAFLGPNGAGKTTTIKTLTGLIYPTSGQIKVLGFVPQERSANYLRQIGLVMGNKSGLTWDLSARQNFYLLKEIYQIGDSDYRERLDRFGQTLNITHLLDRPVRQLSLGERMKLELIASILHNPPILFLDEPTIGLDIISKKNIRNFLRHLQAEEKTTILLTSHDMDDVEHVCDRVVIINHGQKIYDDAISKLVADYEKDRLVKFYFEDEVPEIATPNGTVEERGDGYLTLRVSKGDLSGLVGSVTANFAVQDIDIISLPLEDIISDLFLGKKR